MEQIIGIESADPMVMPNYGKFQAELQKRAMDDNLMEGIGLPAMESILEKTYEPALKVGKQIYNAVKGALGTASDVSNRAIELPSDSNSKFMGSYSYEPVVKNQSGTYSKGNRITDFEELKEPVQPEEFEMQNMARIEPEEFNTLNTSKSNGATFREGASLISEDSESSFSDIAKSALGDIKSFGEGLFEKLGGSVAEEAADSALTALDVGSGIGFIGGLAGMGTLLGEIFKHGPSKPTLPNIMNAPQIRF